MNRLHLWWVVAVIGLIGVGVGPSAADEGAEERDHPPNVRGAWAKLDLTADQAGRIAAIQQQTREKIEQLKQRGQERILAVLTPEQRQAYERVLATRHEKMRIGGMKGALGRMESKLNRTRAKLAAAREAGDAEKAAALEKQLAQQEEKMARYRDKIEAAERRLGDDEDGAEEPRRARGDDTDEGGNRSRGADERDEEERRRGAGDGDRDEAARNAGDDDEG